MSQKIILNSEARKNLQNGINKLADTVTSTLGPYGRNVIFENENGQLVSTKDGVSVAKIVNDLEDPIENFGVRLLKDSALSTANKVGDGTTTSTLLAQTLINQSLVHLDDKHTNVVQLKRDIEDAVKEVLEEVKTNYSKEISSEEQLEQVATISANNDEETGKLVATALQKSGREGIVTIEMSKNGETYLETVEGIQLDKGYKSPYFVTNNDTMTSTLIEPYILIADARFNASKDLLPILEAVSSTGKPLLVIAEDIDGEALATLIVNKMRGTIKVCAIKAPDFGDRRKLLLEDIAIMTGGQVFSKEKGMKLEKFSWDWFGKARSVTVGKDSTTIVEGKGETDAVEKRAEDLVTQIEKSTSPFEIEKLQERLAKFVGGVSIIHVGGFTEAQQKELYDRVEDALFATKAAIDSGIIPGGGVALFKAKEVLKDKLNNIAYETVYKSMSRPLEKILENAGRGLEEIESIKKTILESEDNWTGYDLKTESFVNMLDSKIIDPLKVCQNALNNATSVACTVLLTEGIVFTEKSNTEQVQAQQMY